MSAPPVDAPLADIPAADSPSAGSPTADSPSAGSPTADSPSAGSTAGSTATGPPTTAASAAPIPVSAPEPSVVLPRQRGLPTGTGTAQARPPATAAEGPVAVGPDVPTPVDFTLLRTFGVAGPGHVPDSDDEGTALSVRAPEAPVHRSAVDRTAVDSGAVDSSAATAPVAFRVVGRDGGGIADAVVTLHDDRGRETGGAPSDSAGLGTLSAPHPGSYVLVTAARGFRPGATALTVGDAAAHVEVLLTRGASICGTVRGDDGPQVGVRVALVQDATTVEAVRTAADGGYRFHGLAAGRFGVSVTAHHGDATAVVVLLADEQQARHDIDLGLPRRDVVVSGC